MSGVGYKCVGDLVRWLLRGLVTVTSFLTALLGSWYVGWLQLQVI